MKQVVLIAIALFFFGEPSIAQNELQKELRTRLEGLLPQDQITINSTSLEYSDEIHKFYASQAFESVWTDGTKPKPNATEFLIALEEVIFDGLNPEDYHQSLLLTYMQSINGLNNGQLANLELLLSDAFFQVTKDLHQGKVDHQIFKKEWEIDFKKPQYRYPDLLAETKNGSPVSEIFQKLYPDFRMYENGRAIIKKLSALDRDVSSQWKDLKLKGALRIGQENAIVPEMRKRLAFWGYLAEEDVTQNETYDSVVMRGIQAFQERNGMGSDGVVGKLTVHALNQSPQDLVDKASLNMERLRWLPDTVKTGPLVLVNIANYQLDFLNGRDTLLSERVIVGKRFHESPIFHGEMSYIVFSPYWNLPYSITHNEILPKARKDPGYFAAKNIEIVDNSGKVISPNSVDLSSKKFPYRLRQKPGESNSLGLVKFIFPNNHSVYIHDTPARSLFAREERAMSHGCIRVENPADFAALLLKDSPEWTGDKIYDAMHQSTERTVYLKEKVPVVLLYLTFWADGNGNGHFRPDVYDRDADLLAELRK